MWLFLGGMTVGGLVGVAMMCIFICGAEADKNMNIKEFDNNEKVN